MRLSFVIVVAATTVAVSAKNRLGDYIAVGSPKVYDNTDVDAEIPDLDHALRSLSTDDAFEESGDAEELLARAADDCAGINLRAWPGRTPVSNCNSVFTACALTGCGLSEFSDKRVSPLQRCRQSCSGLVTSVILMPFEPNLSINAAIVAPRDCTQAAKINGMTGDSASWVYTPKPEPVIATTDPRTAQVRIVSGGQPQVSAKGFLAS